MTADEVSLCPEAEYRATLDDGAFYAHVFGLDDGPDDYDPDDDPYAPLPGRLGTPCDECGAMDACGYDAEGRPMIHVSGVDS